MTTMIQMKSILSVVALSLIIASCGTTRNANTITESKGLEGGMVTVQETQTRGIAEADGLSDDGLKVIKVAYVWFSGHGIANQKQAAIDIAQSEAYAAVSREMQQAVLVEAEKANLVNNGEVMQALTQHWQQVSMSVLRGCGPFGNAVVEYNQDTKMYSATAKVGIRGDLYQKLLKEALDYKPSNLSGKNLEDFSRLNSAVEEASTINNQ